MTNCMASSVGVTNNAANFLIGGSSQDLNVGTHQYTFTGVPSNHPMRLVAHGSYASPCSPTLVSATFSTSNAHYYGTVVYDFSACTAPSAVEFQCGVHGTMNLGVPRLTVNSAC